MDDNTNAPVPGPEDSAPGAVPEFGVPADAPTEVPDGMTPEVAAEEIAPQPTPDPHAAPPAVTPQTVSTPAETAAASPAPDARSTPTFGSMALVAILVALIVGTIAGGVAGIAGSWAFTHGRVDSNAPASIRVIPSETDEPVVAATAAALPSIVNVDVTGSAVSSDSGAFPEGHPGVPRMGNGSGVAFREVEGGGTYIITNAHVVEDADTFIVKGTDGEAHRAELVGADADTDIAVLKIDATLPVIQVGNSDDLDVGQTVVAIGSPFGLSHSVSAGVVSALGRSLPNMSDSAPGTYPLVDVIQTDAAINPGNSGGALVDREGRLVGINAAIYSSNGANDGIGFAIPVNTAARVADQLITDGKVRHPFLGVFGRTVDASLAKEENLPVEEGAWVVEVTKGTEAEKAGIATGDVIVGLDDEKIRSMDDLILQVRRKTVGDTVVLKLYRDGELMELTMTVGDKPADIDIPTETTSTVPTE